MIKDHCWGLFSEGALIGWRSKFGFVMAIDLLVLPLQTNCEWDLAKENEL